MEVKPFLERPVKLWLQATNTCNQNCTWCYGVCTREPEPGEWTTQELLDFIDYLVDNDVLQVYIEGGEPFHRPDFMQVLRHCQGRLLTWVRTNATLITPELAKEIKDTGVGAMVVDVMAARKETHDALAGTPGSYERTLAGVRNLVAVGMPLIMAIVVNRANVGELQEYVDLARDLGVGRVGLLRPYPIGRMRERWPELSLRLEEMTEAINALKVPDGVRLMQSWHPKDGNCCWEQAGVDAFGRSVGCSYLRELVDFGNVRETPFFETWHHPLHEHLRSGDVEDHCEDCYHTEGTKGGCRAAARIFTGSWDKADPFCSR